MQKDPLWLAITTCLERRIGGQQLTMIRRGNLDCERANAKC